MQIIDETTQQLNRLSTFLEDLIRGKGDSELEKVIYERRNILSFEGVQRKISNWNEDDKKEIEGKYIPNYSEEFYRNIPWIVQQNYQTFLNQMYRVVIHWDDARFQHMLNEMKIGYVDAMYLFRGLYFTLCQNQIIVELIQEDGKIYDKIIK